MQGLRLALYEAELRAVPTSVCVTGATGYVAGAIIERLLAAGHTVHGTTRSDPASARLLDLPGAATRLVLFQAELSTPGAFHAAVAGCDYVIHVASPLSLTVPSSQARSRLVDPSIAGVDNVIAAVNAAGCVRAMVLTSSVAAVLGDGWERGREHVYTENDWNQSANNDFLPYSRAKTLAEQRAWQLHASQPVGQRHWRLAAMLPGFVVGPPAGKGQQRSEVVQFAVDLLRGRYWAGIPNLQFPFVDLDDVAAAHVLAMLDERATGRYILAAGHRTEGLLDLVAAIQPRFPAYWLPTRAVSKLGLWLLAAATRQISWDLIDAQLDKPFRFDGGRAVRELGLQYHDPALGLADLCERVLQLDLAPRRGDDARAAGPAATSAVHEGAALLHSHARPGP